MQKAERKYKEINKAMRTHENLTKLDNYVKQQLRKRSNERSQSNEDKHRKRNR